MDKFSLGIDEVQTYEDMGLLGPYEVLSIAERRALLGDLLNLIAEKPEFGPEDTGYDISEYFNRLGDDTPWFKSTHMYSKAVRKLASSPRILERVSSILGKDLMLWGAQVIFQKPKVKHKWHIDAESVRWPTVNVWVALQNVTKRSTVSVLTGSHEIESGPRILKEHNEGGRGDEELLSKAQALNPSCELKALLVKNGGFYMFNGKCWHSSCNDTNETRATLLFQYSPPSAEILIPRSFSSHIEWHSYKPPCILVSGTDEYKMNKVVELDTFR